MKAGKALKRLPLRGAGGGALTSRVKQGRTAVVVNFATPPTPLQSGRVDRLLKNLGIKQEAFPGGFDEMFKRMEAYDQIHFLVWQTELKYVPYVDAATLEIPEGSNQPQTMTWRGTFNVGDNANFNWQEYTVSHIVTTQDNTRDLNRKEGETWTLNFQYDEV